MGTKVKTLVGTLVGCMLIAGTATAQTQSPSGSAALDENLYCSLAERVKMPVAFATRDSVFHLSLQQDEPTEIYVQVTVGRNGKVKEKLTRVNANHIATYVAPAFTEAVKGMRIDPALCRMEGKDTAITLTFPIEYQCVLDTMSKVYLGEEYQTPPFYYTTGMAPYAYIQRPVTMEGREKDIQRRVRGYADLMQDKYIHSQPTRVWYYVAVLGAPQR